MKLNLLTPLLIISLLALLQGCATTAKYESLLGTWEGSSESRLVSNWGIPDNTYESNGAKYLKYLRTSSLYVPPTTPVLNTNCTNGGYGSTNCTTTSAGGNQGYNINYSCETTFTLVNAVVTSWKYYGNSCLSNYKSDVVSKPDIGFKSVPYTKEGWIDWYKIKGKIRDATK